MKESAYAFDENHKTRSFDQCCCRALFVEPAISIQNEYILFENDRIRPKVLVHQLCGSAKPRMHFADD